MSSASPVKRLALRRSRENDNTTATAVTTTTTRQTPMTTGQTPFTCIVILRHILSFAAVNAHVFVFIMPQINMSSRETVDSFLDDEWQRLFGCIFDPTQDRRNVLCNSVLSISSRRSVKEQNRTRLQAIAAIARSIAGCEDLCKSQMVAPILRLRDKFIHSSNNDDTREKQRPVATPQAFLDLLAPHLGNVEWSVLLAARSDVVFDHVCAVTTRRGKQIRESDKEWRCNEIRRIIIKLRGFLESSPSRELAMHRVPRLLEIAVHWLQTRVTRVEAEAWLDLLLPFLHFAVSGDIRPVTYRTLQLLDLVASRTGRKEVFGAIAAEGRPAVSGMLSVAALNDLFDDIRRALRQVAHSTRAETNRVSSAPQQFDLQPQPCLEDIFLSDLPDTTLSSDDDGIVNHAVSVAESNIPVLAVINNDVLFELLDDLMTIVGFESASKTGFERLYNRAVKPTDFRAHALELLTRFVHRDSSPELARWALDGNLRLWSAVCPVLNDCYSASKLVELLIDRGTVAEIHSVLKNTNLLIEIVGLIYADEFDRRSKQKCACGIRSIDRLLTISTDEFNFRRMITEKTDLRRVLQVFYEDNESEKLADAAYDLVAKHYPAENPRKFLSG